MRKAQKKQIEEFTGLLGQAHEEIRKYVENKNIPAAMALLEQCQEGAVQIGELIENAEGESVPTIAKLETYCELVYQVYEELSGGTEVNVGKICKKLRKALIQVENSIKNDIRIRLEIVFLPYKVSMWDSLESVWKAADEDPDCDAYVVPIPYYDVNKNSGFGKEYYEGYAYPENVPVTHYNDYDFENRRPDMIFIHNPYDQYNNVTSVHPFFYSKNLKEFTDCLVYIPYYSTSGGMSEAQRCLPSYYYVDYIIVQAEKYKKFFDSNLPQEKLLPFGSPKFDKVIRMCQNPPEPPETWKEKMSGKKVYFYNTSINGMLTDTEAFLKKMEYVFQCFAKCESACLLWRPHPLLESTFDSLRPEYKPIYAELKEYFFENSLGIYDDTSEIQPTIALSDVYIGDEATSVTSLFGITGKPLFVLNNNIHQSPKEDDWRGEIITGFRVLAGCDDWMITQGNKLYYAPNHDYRYEYYCDLSEYAAGRYYLCVIQIDEKIYVCPENAQDILVVQDKKIVKRIELERHIEQVGAFYNVQRIGDYIFLIPFLYPAIVRLDTRNDEVSYLYDGKDVFVKDVKGERRIGGSCAWGRYLLVASPDDSQVLAVDSESMKVQLLSTMAQNKCGCCAMMATETEVWLLPCEGETITRWNPDTGEMKEYSGLPSGFQCYNIAYKYECMELPFYTAAPYHNSILLSPWWGNMFILLDKQTGEMKEWKLPFDISGDRINGYYLADVADMVSCFMQRTDSLGEWTYRYFHMANRKIYDINLETGEYKELPIVFDREELKKHEAGYERDSDWVKYCCRENAFNSLTDLLEERITGQPFSRDKQIQAYQEIAANGDGTCGENVYRFMKEKCRTQ